MNPVSTSISSYPVVGAIKGDRELRHILDTPLKAVFILYGNLLTIKDIVDTLHQHDKLAIVHVGLIEGFDNRDIIVDYIKEYTAADGIISTKPGHIFRAKEKELFAVHRFFILDSLSLEQVERNINGTPADMIEILPGVMPKITASIEKVSKKPVIAGGLISDKEDAMEALKAGAVAISTSCEALWNL